MATLTIIGNAASAPPANGACSCYLVEAADARIVLDLGPGSLPRLRAATSVHAIDAIFFSHLHTDHWIDLLAFNVAYWSEEPSGDARKPIALYLPPGGLSLVEDVFGVLSRGVPGTMAGRWTQAFVAGEYDPAQAITIGSLEVSFVGPTKHATVNYGMRVASGSGVLGYTGDTAFCDEAIGVGRDATYFMAECTLLEAGGHSATHTSAPELGRMARAANCRHLLATHISAQDAAWRDGLLTAIRTEYTGPASIVSLGDRFEF